MRKFGLTTLLCLSLLVSLPLSAASIEFGPAFGPGKEDPGTRLDTIVAVVDDDIITRSELNAALTTIERQARQRNSPLPPQDVLERQVLDRLILNLLQRRAAERNGIVVDDQTVNAALEDIARQNNLTLSQLRETIEQEGFSFAKFREDIRQEISITRLRQRVVDSRIQVSEQEVDNLLTGAQTSQGDQEYHIAQILIAVPEGADQEQLDAGRAKVQEVLEQLRQGADFQRLAVTVSDGRQALEGGDLGWRRVDQLPTLFMDVVPRLQPGQVSDPIRSPSGFHIVKLLEVKGGQRQMITQTHARHILIKTSEVVSDEDAQLHLQRLRDRIVSGEDFGELARAHSNDPASAVQGGDLGWLSPGEVARQFEEKMNALQPGEISEPFKTPFGWHIVQVLERRRHDSTVEAQRAAAREALFKRKSEEEWEQWLRQLRDEAYVEVRLD